MSAGRAFLDALGISAAPVLTTVVGLVVVVCAVIVLGVCFTIVAAPLRGLRLLAAALVFGAIAWAVSAFVVPSILALSSGVVLGTAQRVFVFGTLSAALLVGMRLARSGARIE